MADPAEVVTEFPQQDPQRRPTILPKVAFTQSTLAESPAFWFLFGAIAAFAVVYFLKRK